LDLLFYFLLCLSFPLLELGAFRLMEKDRQDVGQYYAKRWFEFARDDEYDPCLHRFVPALKTRLGIEH
jgi:hypothetical protein